MHSGRALGERSLPGEPYPPPTLPAEAEGAWGWAVAIGERPRCTKGASHLLTREHSGTVRGMLTCWHTSTLTHTHIHTPINISLQPQPHTQECTHAQVCAHRSTHTQPALTAPSHTTSHGLLLASFLQPWPFRREQRPHFPQTPSFILLQFFSNLPQPLSLPTIGISFPSPLNSCHFMVLRYNGNFAHFTT